MQTQTQGHSCPLRHPGDMDFHQICRGCLPQEDLELIRFFGGYPAATVVMETL